MRENLDRAFAFTISQETGNRPDGGYTKNPDDPGGETKWGISKRFHPSVDIRNLTEDGAKAIYLSEYWLKAGCDSLPWPLDMVAFDSAVNPGLGFVLETLKTTRDFKTVLLRRIAHYRDCVKKRPADKEFFEGWVNRVLDLFSICYQ